MKKMILLLIPAVLFGCSWTAKQSDPKPVKYIAPAKFEAPEPIVLPAPPVIENISGTIQRVRKEPFIPAVESENPGEAIRRAEANSKEKATDEKFINAITEYQFEDGKIYEIYIATQRITNIIFQEGEDFDYKQMQLGESTGMHSPVKGFSGSGEKRRVNLMLRPKQAGVDTNMVIPTNKRTYYLNIKSYKNTYQTGVYWTYPIEEYEKKVAQAIQTHEEKQPGFTLNLETANMNYDVVGNAYWRPVRVIDNGQQTCISFPEKTKNRELPPFFIVSDNNQEQLVNYHYDVTLNAYIVHRLFDTGVLKLGKGRENEVYIYNKTSEKHKNETYTAKRFEHAR